MKLVKARFERTEFGGQMVETVKALDFYLEEKSHTSQWQEPEKYKRLRKDIDRLFAQFEIFKLAVKQFWRPVIDYSEIDVWEVLKRNRIAPHPCYRAGWNRCSCAMCIFSTPKLFAGIRELYPEDYELLRQDEKILGFTLDNKCNLDEFVGEAASCVYHGDIEAIRSLITGEFGVNDIYVKGKWLYPAGAFHGAEGGPC